MHDARSRSNGVRPAPARVGRLVDSAFAVGVVVLRDLAVIARD
jgi:hypothetical protein